MTTAWQYDSVGLSMRSTTSSTYGDWSLAKTKAAPLSRNNTFKPIGNKELWKSGQVSSPRAGNEVGTAMPTTDPDSEGAMANDSVGNAPIFQKVKAVDFSKTKFAPRTHQKTGQHQYETTSLKSTQSEPVAGRVDLTIQQQAMSAKMAKRQVNFVSNLEALDTKQRTTLGGFDLNVRRSSPKAGRRALNPETEYTEPSSGYKRGIYSPRGPRKFPDTTVSYAAPIHPFGKMDVNDGSQSGAGGGSGEKQPSGNSTKGATTDWNLTKYDVVPGYAPRNTNAQVITKQLDPINVQFDRYNSKIIDPVPALQRSHTFDYGERRARHQEPPSWQSKLAESTKAQMQQQELLERQGSGAGQRGSKMSPKIGRRNRHADSSYIETCSVNSIKSDEPMRKPGTPIYRPGNYMYKMEKSQAEANGTQTKTSNYNVFQKDISLFDTPGNSSSTQFNNQFMSLSNKTTDAKEFDYDDNLYTIAERSRENSRPGSEAGSDTNSLDYLTSASTMNGVAVSHFSLDLTAGEHDYPGKDQSPKKSILKKNPGLATAQYDLGKMFAASKEIKAPKLQTFLQDDEMSMQSTDKRRVTFNV